LWPGARRRLIYLAKWFSQQFAKRLTRRIDWPTPKEQPVLRDASSGVKSPVPPRWALLALAIWETTVGLGLLLGIFLRGTLLLLRLQMAGTVTPLYFFPEEVFSHFPYAPSLEGQYIIKNLVLISAGIVVGATVRGGRLRS